MSGEAEAIQSAARTADRSQGMSQLPMTGATDSFAWLFGQHKLSVTEEDIRAGVPGDPENCAVALALKRVFPGKQVSINDTAPTLDNRALRLCETIVEF